MLDELKKLINQIGNVGNRPDLKEWRENVLAEIKKIEPHLYGHADTLAGCPICSRD